MITGKTWFLVIVFLILLTFVLLTKGGNMENLSLLMTPQTAQVTDSLQPGMRGDKVKKLQDFLISRNLLSPESATGYYGKKTEQAVLLLKKEPIATSTPRILRLGMSGDDVKDLQTFLGMASTTGYFDIKTKEALIIFQEKYRDEILTPLRLTRGTGILGKATMNKIKSLQQ